VYITLGFDEISEQTGIERVAIQHFLETMIFLGKLNGRICEETRTVSFGDTSDISNLVRTLEQQN
jgi:hypothetical protein